MSKYEDHKFYGTYLKLIEDNYNYRKNIEMSDKSDILEFNKKLRHAKFRNFLISKLGQNYLTIIKLKDVMISLMIKPQRLLTNNLSFYVACDMITNTYYICYKELLMIDIDFYKDNTNKDNNNTNNTNNTNNNTNKGNNNKDDNKDNNNKHINNKLQDIIDMFMKDVESNPNNCWSLYKTRGGIHAFLLSKKMDYTSEETCEYMLSLKSDFNYVIYSHLRGWSVRLNKKEKEEKMNNELLCQLGNPNNIIKDLERQVNLHIKLIEVFKDETPSLMYGV